MIAAALHATVTTGVHLNRTLEDAIAISGGILSGPDAVQTEPGWPVLLIGSNTLMPDQAQGASYPCVLRASWNGWTASLAPRAEPVDSPDPTNVLAAIAGAAIATSEAFGYLSSRPGSDAGFRCVDLDLWSPAGADGSPAPFWRTHHTRGGS